MTVILILSASILTQLGAAILALRLIRITGIRIAWVFIAAACLIQVARRVIPLWQLLSGDVSSPIDLTVELIGLVISVFMLIGIVYVTPLFLSIKSEEESIKEYSVILEEKVEERTRDLRKTQKQLIQNERLAVLGTLGGTISHELRNPLAAIKNSVYFLHMVLKDLDPEVIETLKIMDKEIESCENIIGEILTFANPPKPVRKKIQIADCVNDALSHITIPKNIDVVIQPDEKHPVILGDHGQLCQVFTNILLNAIQAMPEGGQLTIKSEVTTPDWLTISFSDTGVGISEENMKKIFQPLFTTKAKGIGLGLVIIKTLIEGHGGTIEVQSEFGKGCTFTIRLPFSAMEVQA